MFFFFVVLLWNERRCGETKPNYQRQTEVKGKKHCFVLLVKTTQKSFFWELLFFLEKASKSLFPSPMVVKASTVLEQKKTNFNCLFLTRHVLKEKTAFVKKQGKTCGNTEVCLLIIVWSKTQFVATFSFFLFQKAYFSLKVNTRQFPLFFGSFSFDVLNKKKTSFAMRQLSEGKRFQSRNSMQKIEVCLCIISWSKT